MAPSLRFERIPSRLRSPQESWIALLVRAFFHILVKSRQWISVKFNEVESVAKVEESLYSSRKGLKLSVLVEGLRFYFEGPSLSVTSKCERAKCEDEHSCISMMTQTVSNLQANHNCWAQTSGQQRTAEFQGVFKTVKDLFRANVGDLFWVNVGYLSFGKRWGSFSFSSQTVLDWNFPSFRSKVR